MGTSLTKLICTTGKATLTSNSTKVYKASMSKTCGSKTHQNVSNVQSLTIIVGDTAPYLSEFAKKIDEKSYIINSDNVYNSLAGTGYVSLGDLSGVDELFYILSNATRIIYAKPDRWSDGQTESSEYSMAWITIHYINLVSSLYTIPVDNLSIIPSAIETIPPRITSESQLWVAGCSTTYGLGVDVDQRYGNLIANKLGLELTMLAQSGTSNPWSADQILRANILKGDIVIWGLTTYGRHTWVHNNQLKHVNSNFYVTNPWFNKIISLDFLDSEQRLYESITSIYQVQKYCQKVGIKLILAGIHANIEVSTAVATEKNFVMLHGIKGLNFDSDFLDYGSDGIHPGALTHQFYADEIFKKLKQQNN